MDDTSKALLNLLERILGKSIKKSKCNYAFVCPFHISDPPGKRKLEINIETENWRCWTCYNINNSRGKSILPLLKKMEAPSSYISEYKLISPNKRNIITNNESTIKLPDEFLHLNIIPKDSLQKLTLKKAKNYLKERGITNQDIIKYNIGFCDSGKYENRIVIPSYDENGALNYFIARDFTNLALDKYLKPSISSKEIIGMSYYINWDLPIILVEGIFDMLTVRRNCIPLFGKYIPNPLMKKLVTSKVKKIYISLDKDAIKESIEYCKELMKYGKEVHLLEIEEKDINVIGFKRFLDVLEQSNPLTFQDLLLKKLNYEKNY